MADDLSKKSEHLEQLEEAARKQKDPTLTASVKLLSSVERTVEKQNQRIDDLRDETAEGISAIREDVEAGKTAYMEGQRQLVDKIHNLEKRQILSSGVTPGGKFPEEILKEALSEKDRGLAYLAERTMYRNSSSPERDSIRAAAIETWYKTAAKLQMRQYSAQSAQNSEKLDKLNKAFAELDSSTKAAYSTTASGGGVGIPAPAAAEVLRLVLDSSVVYSRARHIPMASKTLKIPREQTGFTIYWPGEGSAITQGEGDFESLTLTANKLAGYALASSEVVEDANFGIMGFIQAIIAEKFGRELDTQALEGSGSPFTGVNGASGVNSVNTTTGTDGGALAYSDLVTAMFKAGEMSTRENAAWFMNPVIYGVVLGLVDTSGQPIVKYGTVESAPMGTILGRPVYTSNALDITITASTDATGHIYFGPPQGLVFGDRRGMTFDVSEHVKFAEDQLALRMTMRTAFGVGVPAAWTKIINIHSD